MPSKYNPLIVIPVYNHRDGLQTIISSVHSYGNVLVVDDGCTDNSVDERVEKLATVIRHRTNKGKGAAILSASRYAKENNYSHLITIDADTQHLAEDIPKFIEAINSSPESIIVGVRDFSKSELNKNIPKSATWGRSFSNFWYRVQTGEVGEDTQCGFRAYPVKVLESKLCGDSRYSFETEVIVKANWAGVKIKWIGIQVFYPEPEKRITHMHRVKDNIRLSWLNTRLTMRAVVPWPYKQLDPTKDNNFSFRQPIQSMRNLLKTGVSPLNIGLSIFMGVLLGILPLFAIHTVAILFSASFFRLSKVLSVGISQFCAPPLAPAICIEVGHRILYGKWLIDASWQTLGLEFLDRAWEWIIGSLIVAPVLAVIAGVIFYGLAFFLQKVGSRL
ncbi:MAG: DUF2062 domain-containing protein [Desulfotalea sp.]